MHSLFFWVNIYNDETLKIEMLSYMLYLTLFNCRPIKKTTNPPSDASLMTQKLNVP